jgi:hypothetical protein
VTLHNNYLFLNSLMLQEMIAEKIRTFSASGTRYKREFDPGIISTMGSKGEFTNVNVKADLLWIANHLCIFVCEGPSTSIPASTQDEA